jgi:hypothetical protein
MQRGDLETGVGPDLIGNSFRLLEQALTVSVPREPAPLPETTARTVARLPDQAGPPRCWQNS